MADLIGIGLTGLKSHQVALSVTGNNVANTNTQGYSRQQAIFEDNPSLLTGAGFIGQGVNIDTVRRISQSFVVDQVRADTSVYHLRDATLTQAQSVDNLLASTTTGLTPSLSRFFEAFQGSADDPTSIPQRQLLLTQTEGLVSRFHSLEQSLTAQKKNIDQSIEAAVSSINSLAQGLVEINRAISLASSTASQGNEPNQLLDARDETLRQLSELVTVTSIDQGSNGQVNVFIGNGQPLVIGDDATLITTPLSAANSRTLDVALVSNGTEQIVTENITGGRLGGLIEFRDHELQDAINGLGRVAIVLADTVNAQHSLGMDLENNIGGMFFTDINDDTLARNRVIANGNNPPPADQLLRVNIIDSSRLTTDDYEVRFEGPTDDDFVVVRLSDNSVAIQSSLPGIFPATVELDGFDLQFESGTFRQGDYFTVQPTRNGASDIQTVVDRVEELAFASPIRSHANLGNVGNATISLGTMLDVNSPITNQPLPTFAVNGELSPPLGIRFISDDYYEVVNLSNPSSPEPLVPPMNNLRYNQGLNNPIFTTDPGETMISARGAEVLSVPVPGPSAGVLTNGYSAQNLNFLTRDPESGLVSTQTVAIAPGSSAQTIANSLTALSGVSANAYTQVSLSNFVDNGDASPLGLEINGEPLLVTAPAVFGPDALADIINSNPTLEAQGMFAVSDGDNLSIRSFVGADIEVVVTGTGDSIDLSKIDPYTAGNPALGTQTISSGNGLVVGGMLDVSMGNGVSMTADSASVFEAAPIATSSYLGFQFEIQGEAVQGDRFFIEYNTDGISDNRNALAMAQLEGKGLISDGVTSYGEAYAQIVEEVGTVTNRARLDEEAARSLLEQSTNTRDSISGVNLDEEAGRLIQYQAAYNASAQVVSVARELFDTLLGAFR